MLSGFKLLHFHLGSQILDIQNLKQAVKEIARVYARLRTRGVDIQYINVGGGLGVNYEAGEVTAPHGINYTLEEYTNAVVYSVKEICDAEKVPHPILVSENGTRPYGASLRAYRRSDRRQFAGNIRRGRACRGKRKPSG